MTGQATASPGGWTHLGDAGTAGSRALNGTVSALNASGQRLLVGGNFTDAGGDPAADRIASWSSSGWSAVGSSTSRISTGAVDAIAYAGGKVYAGGTFTNAGGNADADYLAVWNGSSWGPACTGTPLNGTVYALKIIGSKLYVGGSFVDAAGIVSADYLVACDLTTGAPSSTVADAAHAFSGAVYALTADANGILYVGGGFQNLANDAAADHVAYLQGGQWHAMGSGPAACGCAVDDYVRSLAASGSDVYVGTDASDVAGIARADKVARWNGSAWSAMGSNTAGDNGWFPASATINGLTISSSASGVYATGTFQDANGDPRADGVARFDGSAWHAVGSDGAGNGPWTGSGLALASFGGDLYAGGNFTTAGGDAQATYAARYPSKYTLTIDRGAFVGGNVSVKPAGGTVTVCAPSCSPTFAPGTVVALFARSNANASFDGWGGACSGARSCTVTMSADKRVIATWHRIPPPPSTKITGVAIKHAKRQATFDFIGSGGSGKRYFQCKLDSGDWTVCTSPKSYTGLSRGSHTFTVRALDARHKPDPSPAKHGFTI
jgi:hypothetical protein